MAQNSTSLLDDADNDRQSLSPVTSFMSPKEHLQFSYSCLDAMSWSTNPKNWEAQWKPPYSVFLGVVCDRVLSTLNAEPPTQFSQDLSLLAVQEQPIMSKHLAELVDAAQDPNTSLPGSYPGTMYPDLLIILYSGVNGIGRHISVKKTFVLLFELKRAPRRSLLWNAEPTDDVMHQLRIKLTRAIGQVEAQAALAGSRRSGIQGPLVLTAAVGPFWTWARTPDGIPLALNGKQAMDALKFYQDEEDAENLIAVDEDEPSSTVTSFAGLADRHIPFALNSAGWQSKLFNAAEVQEMSPHETWGTTPQWSKIFILGTQESDDEFKKMVDTLKDIVLEQVRH